MCNIEYPGVAKYQSAPCYGGAHSMHSRMQSFSFEYLKAISKENMNGESMAWVY